MPTYEYECTECGHLFEVFQSITAQPIQECPKCNGKVRKLLSTGIGIIFKGSGFYSTDYKKILPRNKEKSVNNENSHAAKADSQKKSASPGDSKSTNEHKNEKKSND